MQLCDACTVLVDDRAVSSCCLLAADARDTDVLTIEGIAADGRLHPLQEEFISHGAFQCGYCTPGIIMTAYALFLEKPKPSRKEIHEYLTGTLCRCGSYMEIVDAIAAAAARTDLLERR